MSTTNEKPDTHQKALSINLDAEVFGSFAEIGAGQEVARWFLTVGGASGTVAKTISAYDKEVSDDLYGAGTRYVSKPRLQAMLEGEWKQLLSQLQASRGAVTRFFSFVDTVSARNFAGTNDCHGWIGLRFLMEPGGPPSDVILHVNLRDSTNLRQQEAVGILGVNLIYAVRHARESIEEFLSSLFEELSLQRLEIDLVELSGPAFAGWSRDEVHVALVTGGYAKVVTFSAEGELAPANELLYKRALVLAPTTLDAAGELGAELVTNTLGRLPAEEVRASKGGLGLFGLSTASTRAEDAPPAVKDVVTQVNKLQKMGYGVFVFGGREIYAASAFANRYTKSRIHFAIGLTALMRVFEDRYGDLAGTLLEGLSRLFMENVRVSVCPMPVEDVQRRVQAAGVQGWRWQETNGLVTADNLHPPAPLDALYQYLLSSGLVIPGS
jgi:hypothetical protein